MPQRASMPDPPWLSRAAYPFTSRRVELADGSLHYVDEGSGPAVLMVHGTPTWSFEWRHLVRELSSEFRCIAPDHLGFGLSDRPAGADYTPAAHAARLRQFLEALGLRDLTLVVHDFGGLIGLPLALEQQGLVSRLVVMNSWMWHLGEDPKVARAARLLGGRFGRFLYGAGNFSLRVMLPTAFADRTKLTGQIRAHYHGPFPDPASRAQVLWPLARSLGPPSPHADALWAGRSALAGLPALIIWGMRDPALGPHQLTRWQEALPDAKVSRLEAGHWPQEEEPEAVIAEIHQFAGRRAA